ncbi:MAG: hypothetical protein DRI48_00935 [Chloroflexi bacterium]|nr:MAG: hypothetical protein DRI48_00935 [Chloroflexota bacterium]
MIANIEKVHDMDYLMTLLPPEAEEVVGLTSYAVMFRYPGDYEEVTKEEYWEAMRIARKVVAWAEQIISGAEANERGVFHFS